MIGGACRISYYVLTATTVYGNTNMALVIIAFDLETQMTAGGSLRMQGLPRLVCRGAYSPCSPRTRAGMAACFIWPSRYSDRPVAGSATLIKQLALDQQSEMCLLRVTCGN